jgi:NitT/TauT family transport system substrate-binding protein
MLASSRSRFLAAGAAFTLATRVPAGAQPFPTLRVGGLQAQESSMELWMGLDLGFFSKAGLNVEPMSFNSGNAAAAAMLGGSLDIALTTTLTLASAAIRGVPFQIIAAGPVNTRKAPTLLAVVKKDSPIREARDLVGKTAGMNTLRTISELAMDVWLAKHNVDIPSVKAVEIPFAQILPALARGTIDCGLPGEPQLSAALRANEIKIIGDPTSEIAPRVLSGLWFTTHDFARKNPEAVKRFAAAIYQTGRWANRHHAESAPIVAKYTKLPIEDVNVMMRADFAEDLRFSELQPTLDAALKFGFIPRPLKAQDLAAGA